MAFILQQNETYTTERLSLAASQSRIVQLQYIDQLGISNMNEA